MPHDPARVAETREWLEKAALDLRSNRIDLDAKPPLLEDARNCQGKWRALPPSGYEGASHLGAQGDGTIRHRARAASRRGSTLTGSVPA